MLAGTLSNHKLALWLARHTGRVAIWARILARLAPQCNEQRATGSMHTSTISTPYVWTKDLGIIGEDGGLDTLVVSTNVASSLATIMATNCPFVTVLLS